MNDKDFQNNMMQKLRAIMTFIVLKQLTRFVNSYHHVLPVFLSTATPMTQRRQ
jgi:hypothetical protein